MSLSNGVTAGVEVAMCGLRVRVRGGAGTRQVRIQRIHEIQLTCLQDKVLKG